jgi:hypothetical protein
MTPEHSRPRQCARLIFQDPVCGRVLATHDAQIHDLSLRGARLEHTVVLRPGSTCYVRVPLGQLFVTVVGSVVWSQVVGRAANRPDGSTGLRYQSGLEFGNLAAETRARLTVFLERQGLLRPENGGPAPRSN